MWSSVVLFDLFIIHIKYGVCLEVTYNGICRFLLKDHLILELLQALFFLFYILHYLTRLNIFGKFLLLLWSYIKAQWTLLDHHWHSWKPNWTTGPCRLIWGCQLLMIGLLCPLLDKVLPCIFDPTLVCWGLRTITSWTALHSWILLG